METESPFCPFALLALKVRRRVPHALRCAGLPCPHLPAPRDPCRCCAGPAPFPTRRRSVQLDEVQHSGSGLPSNRHQQPFPGDSGPVASHRQLPCTSICLIHDLDRDPTPPGPPEYLVASAIPTAAAPLVVPGRPQLQANSRPSAAFGGAGALVPGLVRRWKWTVDSGQSTGLPLSDQKSDQKKNRRGPALRNPNRCRAACSPPATLHPPPGPTDAAPAIAKSEQRPRLRPPSPSPSPSSASPRASAAAKLLSPVVASRPSPVTHPCRSPPTRSCTHPRRPPPPPDCPPPSESIEPATRHHPASSPTPSTIATSRDPDHPSAP